MKYLRWLAAAAAVLVSVLPASARKIIPVETDHVQLILAVQENGVLQTLHFGAKIADPTAFEAFGTGRGTDNGEGPMAYPTTGGRYIGEPALHVKYVDGYHNTQLFYTGHTVHANGNIVTTVVTLKDKVTLMEVKLMFDAYQKEDVICTHTEILNGGKQPVELLNYASGSLYLDANQYFLTHFYGGWANEMQMDGEVLTHDTKVIESRSRTTRRLSNPVAARRPPSATTRPSWSAWTPTACRRMWARLLRALWPGAVISACPSRWTKRTA